MARGLSLCGDCARLSLSELGLVGSMILAELVEDEAEELSGSSRRDRGRFTRR